MYACSRKTIVSSTAKILGRTCVALTHMRSVRNCGWKKFFSFSISLPEATLSNRQRRFRNFSFFFSQIYKCFWENGSLILPQNNRINGTWEYQRITSRARGLIRQIYTYFLHWIFVGKKPCDSRSDINDQHIWRHTILYIRIIVMFHV